MHAATTSEPWSTAIRTEPTATLAEARSCVASSSAVALKCSRHFTGNEGAVAGRKHRPLKASDGSKQLPIAANAKEETSANLANFVIASLRLQPEHASCTVQTMCRVSWQSRSRAWASHLGNAVVTQAIAGEWVDMFKSRSQQTILEGEPGERLVRQYRSARSAYALTAQRVAVDCGAKSDPHHARQQFRSPDTSALPADRCPRVEGEDLDRPP